MTEEEIAAIAAQLRRLPDGWGLEMGRASQVFKWERPAKALVWGGDRLAEREAPTLSAALMLALDAAGVPE